MNSLHSRMSGLLAAGCVGLMLFCSSAFAQFVSREQIVEALTTQPASLNFTDRLGLTRSLTLKVAKVAASVQPKATIDLHEVFFEFNSAAVTDEAKPQLRELAAALSDPRLKGSIISIGGHTDAVGSDAFNQNQMPARGRDLRHHVGREPALQLGICSGKLPVFPEVEQ